MGLYGPNTPQPPYASIMMIELYLQDDGYCILFTEYSILISFWIFCRSYAVEVYYHMGPEADSPAEFMALPGCPSPCTLEKFKA